MTRKQDSTVNDNTRDRVPFGGHRLNLSVPDQDAGYVYYWFNDSEDRIPRALAAGYVFVQKDELGGKDVGEKDLHSGSTSLDTRVSKRLRNYNVYLMKIKKEFWNEDRATKDLQADKVDEAIFGGGADRVPQAYGLDVNYKPR